MLGISFAMQQGQDAKRLIPTVLRRQPAWRVREEKQTDKEDGSRDDLDAPGDAECSGRLVWVVGSATDLSGAVLDEELDEDAPRDGPLLQRDNAAADLLWRDLRLVYRDN